MDLNQVSHEDVQQLRSSFASDEELKQFIVDTRSMWGDFIKNVKSYYLHKKNGEDGGNKKGLLLDDGECRLYFDDMKDVFPDQDMFSFVCSNGGGFSSLLFTKECWENMKVIVDKAIAESSRGTVGR